MQTLAHYYNYSGQVIVFLCSEVITEYELNNAKVSQSQS